MARSAHAQKLDGGTAGRVAARRRATPSRGVASPKSAGKRARKGDSAGLFARGVKLAVLMALMGVIGFFAVLVVDVTGSFVGRVHFGDTTFAALWEKVVDRVLDRDVPRLPDPPAPKLKPLKPPAPKPRAFAGGDEGRAPLPAARPDEDARHVAPRADVQVEHAQKRLDDLLQRL
jgi:hypothetical protein